MQDDVRISCLSGFEGKPVTIRGWLAGRRTGGKIVFLLIRDGSGFCQAVVEASSPDAFSNAQSAGLESSLAITGTVRRDERAPGQFEIAVSELHVIQNVRDYPIARKSHGIDFLMSHRHLWLRSRIPWTILRVRHTVISACREFMNRRGFVLVDTPILVGGAGEDTRSLFPVDYFGEKAFLTQTGQLYLESACMALGKVYCFGPTFRAEKSKTRRHLCEFWMLEPEAAFASLDDVIQLAEDLICHVVGAVLKEHSADLEAIGRDVKPLCNIAKPFRRLTYSEAVELLRSEQTRIRLETDMAHGRTRLQYLADELEKAEKRLASASKQNQKDSAGAKIVSLREEIAELEAELAAMPEHLRLAQSFQWGNDLGGSDETIVSRSFERPVFVTHYPREAKAFYMKLDPENPRVVLNMDLLAPEGYGEIIGGSQREDDPDRLVERMREKGLNPEDYSWYLDLRKYGSVPHSGFGLGIERLVAWITGRRHVRETIPFPRTLGRFTP